MPRGVLTSSISLFTLLLHSIRAKHSRINNLAELPRWLRGSAPMPSSSQGKAHTSNDIRFEMKHAREICILIILLACIAYIFRRLQENRPYQKKLLASSALLNYVSTSRRSVASSSSFCSASLRDNDRCRSHSFGEKDPVSCTGVLTDEGALIHCNALRFGIVCQQGLKPKCPNQDSFSITHEENAFQLFGVYDGHGPFGHDVSKLVKEFLPHQFRMNLANGLQEEAAFVNAFSATQKMLQRSTRKGKVDATRSGTTATLVYIPYPRHVLFVAHVGDSRAMLVHSSGRFSNITEDHKPEIEKEKQRIISRGGEVRFDGLFHHRVYAKGGCLPGLNMSRAFGDIEGHQTAGIIAEPDFSIVSLDSKCDAGLIIASDGLWEFLSGTDCLQIVDTVLQGRSFGQHTQEVVEALASRSRELWLQDSQGQEVDDITAICVAFS